MLNNLEIPIAKFIRTLPNCHFQYDYCVGQYTIFIETDTKKCL